MKNVPAGSKRRLVFVLFLVVWFLKFILGLTAATRPDAPSYPDAVRGFPSPYIGDIGFYVVIPAVFVVLNVLIFVFARKLPKWLAVIVAVAQTILLLMFLLFSTGGI
jgi:hypothetical protein